MFTFTSVDKPDRPFTVQDLSNCAHLLMPIMTMGIDYSIWFAINFPKDAMDEKEVNKCIQEDVAEYAFNPSKVKEKYAKMPDAVGFSDNTDIHRMVTFIDADLKVHEIIEDGDAPKPVPRSDMDASLNTLPSGKHAIVFYLPSTGAVMATAYRDNGTWHVTCCFIQDPFCKLFRYNNVNTNSSVMCNLPLSTLAHLPRPVNPKYAQCPDNATEVKIVPYSDINIDTSYKVGKDVFLKEMREAYPGFDRTLSLLCSLDCSTEEAFKTIMGIDGDGDDPYASKTEQPIHVKLIFVNDIQYLPELIMLFRQYGIVDIAGWFNKHFPHGAPSIEAIKEELEKERQNYDFTLELFLETPITASLKELGINPREWFLEHFPSGVANIIDLYDALCELLGGHCPELLELLEEWLRAKGNAKVPVKMFTGIPLLTKRVKDKGLDPEKWFIEQFPANIPTIDELCAAIEVLVKPNVDDIMGLLSHSNLTGYGSMPG